MNIKNWVCGCLVIVLLCVSNLFATTLNVPGILYPTIQSAINAAVNGDTVLVQPGTYYETIDFLGKEITIVFQWWRISLLLLMQIKRIQLCISGTTKQAILFLTVLHSQTV